MPIESGRPDRQSDREPIIENEHLPRMEDQRARPSGLMLAEDRIIDGAGVDTLPPPLAINLDQGPTERMAPFSEKYSDREAPSGKGEQRARAVRQDSNGYLRLRVRLEKDVLTVVGARTVEGPLAFDESLLGDLVYEVRADDHRIGIGTVPDAGQMRSFPPPEPQEGQIGHHIVPLRATEFNVRIPSDALRSIAPERIRIDVFTMKARPDRPQLSAEPLQAQLGSDARLVARLDGLVLEKLGSQVREEIQRALRKY